jgi:hypothetical protein
MVLKLFRFAGIVEKNYSGVGNESLFPFLYSMLTTDCGKNISTTE